jgi:hypothetical protein
MRQIKVSNFAHRLNLFCLQAHVLLHSMLGKADWAKEGQRRQTGINMASFEKTSKVIVGSRYS